MMTLKDIKNIKKIIAKVKEKLADNKMTKEEAQYDEISKVTNQICGNCHLSYRDNTSNLYYCRKVEGTIEYDAWCNLWEGK